MFKRFFSQNEAPLTGAPAVRRLKSYSAGSGYVYQYFYEGHRAARGGVEHVFSVSADRKKWLGAPVMLEDAAVRAWEAAHGRELASNERYAVAKMALFQAFDERAEPSRMTAAIRVRAADLEAIVERLGL